MSEAHKADAFPIVPIGAHVVTGDKAVCYSTHVVGNNINVDLLQRLWRG